MRVRVVVVVGRRFVANADSDPTNLIRFIAFAVAQTATAGATAIWRASPGWSTLGRLKRRLGPSKACCVD